MITHYLFVYGTLRRGFSNPYAQVLQQNATWIGKGTFPGVLYQISWYPGAIYTPDSLSKVQGEIYELTQNADQIVQELDKYEDITAENSEYIRDIIPVYTEDGRVIHCWTYLFNQPVNGLQLIEDGYFRE